MSVSRLTDYAKEADRITEYHKSSYELLLKFIDSPVGICYRDPVYVSFNKTPEENNINQLTLWLEGKISYEECYQKISTD